MKLLRQTKLAFQEGKSDKVYEIDLCQVGENQYVVNFRYGRRGSNLKDGSKTTLPVTLDKAEKIFDDLAASKKKKGYWDIKDGPPMAPPPPPPTQKPRDSLSKRKKTVLAQLEAAIEETAEDDLERPLGRLVWRAGEMELKEAVPLLIKLGESGDPITDYSLAWALGRCGETTALPLLKKIYANASQPVHVRQMAVEAYRSMIGGKERSEFLKSVAGHLPPPLRDLHPDGDAETFDRGTGDGA